jgi:hypothetical protein
MDCIAVIDSHACAAAGECRQPTSMDQLAQHAADAAAAAAPPHRPPKQSRSSVSAREVRPRRSGSSSTLTIELDDAMHIDEPPLFSSPARTPDAGGDAAGGARGGVGVPNAVFGVCSTILSALTRFSSLDSLRSNSRRQSQTLAIAEPSPGDVDDPMGAAAPAACCST